jgi:hypothetical protein
LKDSAKASAEKSPSSEEGVKAIFILPQTDIFALAEVFRFSAFGAK